MPLMIIPPPDAAIAGFQPGSRCDAPVSLLDLYPTLLDICGLPPRESLEGQSLLPLVADPQADWSDTVVTTVGRGTHSVHSRHWRYVRYFDGSEELYDLRTDPREWFNIASDPEHESVKRPLASVIREDDRFRQFARYGRWKCVFPVDGPPMLFDYRGVFGISEQTDLASDRPDVIAAVQDYLDANGITSRRVNIPENDGRNSP
jgi:hypothetical protein